MNRREFLIKAGVSTVAAALPMPVIAAPKEELVPYSMPITIDTFRGDYGHFTVTDLYSFCKKEWANRDEVELMFPIGVIK